MHTDITRFKTSFTLHTDKAGIMNVAIPAQTVSLVVGNDEATYRFMTAVFFDLVERYPTCQHRFFGDQSALYAFSSAVEKREQYRTLLEGMSGDTIAVVRNDGNLSEIARAAAMHHEPRHLDGGLTIVDRLDGVDRLNPQPPTTYTTLHEAATWHTDSSRVFFLRDRFISDVQSPSDMTLHQIWDMSTPHIIDIIFAVMIDHGYLYVKMLKSPSYIQGILHGEEE